MRAVGKNFWISLAARVVSPGCKVDNIVVLEGSQGTGKSTVAAAIGGSWFAEQHESATNPKAFAEIIQGEVISRFPKWMCLRRAEVGRVKQTITCQSDRFRPSYGRHAVDHPRQCVFIGTVNADDWNRDVTGARRFWPISCQGPANVCWVIDNRDQLFAEAVARLKAGESWWEMPAEETTEQQDMRYTPDVWEDEISRIVGVEYRIPSLRFLLGWA